MVKPYTGYDEDGNPQDENAYIYAGSHRWAAWIGGLVAVSLILLAAAAIIRDGWLG